jgi:hypothetical protein
LTTTVKLEDRIHIGITAAVTVTLWEPGLQIRNQAVILHGWTGSETKSTLVARYKSRAGQNLTTKTTSSLQLYKSERRINVSPPAYEPETHGGETMLKAPPKTASPPGSPFFDGETKERAKDFL